MKRRMTMATAVAALALVTLSGCGTDANPPAAAPSTSPSTSPSSTTPSADPTTPAASDLAGDWHDVKAQWTVHFHDDGTFVEDFKGLTDFRVGKYTVDGTTVSLIGDEGDTDVGKIEGDTLVFKLGTLTRI
jgi:hypothetical protein